ncbi:hypothetical protein [Streptomyces scopuliridis]|uniref:hypothetical protein n=1 Tax=Streptomyces scopuliridis TaxID=452529 RepID=UPI00342402C1
MTISQERDARPTTSTRTLRSRKGPLPRPTLNLPLEFKAFCLGHQELFHDYAEVQFGSRPTAEEVIHRVFREILGPAGPVS